MQLLNRDPTEFSSKAQWLREFLAIAPEPIAMEVIGIYNAVPIFGRTLGWFSVEEIEDAIRSAKHAGTRR